MSNIKKTLAVAETSYIIRKGLVHVLSQLSSVSRVVELKEMDDMGSQINLIQPDAVIINPMLLGGHTAKSDIRQLLGLHSETAVVALVYNMIDEKFYKSYDAIIKINDSGPKIEKLLMEALNKGGKLNSDQEELTDREEEILISVVKGMSNKEIANHHNISIHTAITHRRNITRKLKINSIPGLTIYAIINKLIDISEINY